MASNSESFGMMSEAYFVGRYELIQWINEFLQMNIRKVEECATGAIHCQIFDALYPGKMPMSKVNFEAKHDYEFVKNFKLLQNLFVSVGINKIVPVERIVKARYQDNLELLQWVYEYFNRNYNGQDYDPIRRRSKSKGGSKSTRRAPAGTRAAPVKRGKENDRIAAASKPPTRAAAPKRAAAASPGADQAAENSFMLAKAQKEVQELHTVVRDLEKERDFYFAKILQVETLCKERDTVAGTDQGFISQILDILYATEHEDGAAEEDTGVAEIEDKLNSLETSEERSDDVLI